MSATDDPVTRVSELRRAIARDATNAANHRMLGRALRKLGRDEEAQLAEMTAIRMSAYDPEMAAIARAMLGNDLPQAETRLRQRLKDDPLDVAAIRLMAELAARIGRYRDSETLLRRALELAPGFIAARGNLATVLYKQHRFAEALRELDIVLQDGESGAGNLNLKAAALGRVGDYEEARRIYADLARTFPDQARLWMSLGHILKTLGEQSESIAAYRRALEIEPGLGEVWWSLANLKTLQFDDADVAAMESALANGQALSHEDRFHLHFALGKACEGRGAPEKSFGHYAAGNRLRSEELAHDPAIVTGQVDRMMARLTSAFVAERSGKGDPAPDAIFILGMPRAGSTLIEQILSSHSRIEGTMELPDIPQMVMREVREAGAGAGDWTATLAKLSEDRLRELGAEFLERTRIQRKTDKPFFIDKLPNNWTYLGFIALILPNARIIDARRHPLDCCFSNFRQHFAKGQAFSYDLEHVGRYYADYVRAMEHYDAVLPGRVHRVIHERLLDDPQGEVQRMLSYLDLPFEEACLRFHHNTRAVRTASSEQVRRPINRDGVDQWRAYEPWLGPLKAVLGVLPERYARD